MNPFVIKRKKGIARIMAHKITMRKGLTIKKHDPTNKNNTAIRSSCVIGIWLFIDQVILDSS